MRTFREEVEQRVLDVAWSLWSEAGVSGWSRRHSALAIDIEPLIVFTASLSDIDPRLRDEATDWCTRFGQLVSKVRLKNILKYPIAPPRAFGEFAATVNAHSLLSWPSEGKPRRFVPSMKSDLDLARASLIQLRARAIFGVAARAEVLSTYAVTPSTVFTMSGLADQIHFGRRVTADAVDILRAAGMLSEGAASPARSYTLIRQKELRELLAPVPEQLPRWTERFVVMKAISDIGRTVTERSELVRAVEVQKRLAEIDRHVFIAGLPHVPKIDASPTGWTRFTEWALDILSRVSGGA